MSHTQSAFETALEELGVTVEYTPAAELAAAVEDAVVLPAAGADFGGSAVSLGATSVTVDPTPVELRRATTGVTAADLGVGEYGSLVLSMDTQGSELVRFGLSYTAAVR